MTGYRAQSLAPRRLPTAIVALLLTFIVIAVAGAHTALAACANPVACENQLPGDPQSDWQVDGVGDPSIQGYPTQMSVNAGDTEQFKINTPSAGYHIDILRLGYYGGDGARKVAANIKPTATLPQTQPACQTFSDTGLIDCGNWSVSASWTVPANAVSGVYIAHLVRDDSKDLGGDSQIPFVVRNDSSHSDMVVATDDATWQAYNDYGGNSLYTCTVACPPGNPLGYKAAYSVSYNRPFDGGFITDNGASYLWYTEYQMIRFLEENGYDVSYVADADLDRSGSLLLNHKLFISSGHDEYWSGPNATTSRRRSTRVSTWRSSAPTRCSGRRDGATARTAQTPPTGHSLLTRRRTSTRWSTRKTRRSGPGSWGDPRFSPPADGGVPTNR